MARTNKSNYRRMTINSEKLISDQDYQRAIDERRVRRIVAGFNPDLVNEPKVSSRDGLFYVFDGQHTVAALKMMNNNRHLPIECKVYTGLTRQDEARLFAEQNGFSKPVATSDRIRALYTAGDVDICDMRETLEGLGITCNFSNNKASYKIVAYGTVLRIFTNVPREDFIQIIELIKQSWGGDADSFSREILSGMHMFYITYKGILSFSKAVNKFGKVSPLKIVRDGKLYPLGGVKRFASQLVAIYNKGSKTRLDERLLGD